MYTFIIQHNEYFFVHSITDQLVFIIVISCARFIFDLNKNN